MKDCRGEERSEGQCGRGGRYRDDAVRAGQGRVASRRRRATAAAAGGSQLAPTSAGRAPRALQQLCQRQEQRLAALGNLIILHLAECDGGRRRGCRWLQGCRRGFQAGRAGAGQGRPAHPPLLQQAARSTSRGRHSPTPSLHTCRALCFAAPPPLPPRRCRRLQVQSAEGGEASTSSSRFAGGQGFTMRAALLGPISQAPPAQKQNHHHRRTGDIVLAAGLKHAVDRIGILGAHQRQPRLLQHLAAVGRLCWARRGGG